VTAAIREHKQRKQQQQEQGQLQAKQVLAQSYLEKHRRQREQQEREQQQHQHDEQEQEQQPAGVRSMPLSMLSGSVEQFQANNGEDFCANNTANAALRAEAVHKTAPLL